MILRASKAGFPCARNIWYSARGYAGIVSEHSLRIFDIGTYLEPMVVKWLREDGWEVDYNPGSQSAELKYELPVKGGKLSGHPDCFISRPGFENVLIDIKTMNERAFTIWKREGTLKKYPQYADQLHIYAQGAIWSGRKVEKLGIVAVNKNNSAMHMDFFDFDEKRFAQIRERAEKIFATPEAPCEGCPSEKWCCGYCEYAALCELHSKGEKDTTVGDDIAVTSDNDVINAMELLKEARELSKTGKELEDEAKVVLDEKIRQRGIKAIKAGGLVLKLSERASTRFDSTAFKKVHPELVQEFSKTSTSVTYELKEA